MNRGANSRNVVVCWTSFVRSGLPFTNSTRSRDSAQRCAALFDAVGALRRSRSTVPSGSAIRMSTSHPPSIYGRTVTLIALLLWRERVFLVEPVYQVGPAHKHASADARHAGELIALDHGVDRTPTRAQQQRRFVDRQQNWQRVWRTGFHNARA